MSQFIDGEGFFVSSWVVTVVFPGAKPELSVILKCLNSHKLRTKPLPWSRAPDVEDISGVTAAP